MKKLQKSISILTLLLFTLIVFVTTFLLYVKTRVHYYEDAKSVFLKGSCNEESIDRYREILKYNKQKSSIDGVAISSLDKKLIRIYEKLTGNSVELLEVNTLDRNIIYEVNTKVDTLAPEGFSFEVVHKASELTEVESFRLNINSSTIQCTIRNSPDDSYFESRTYVGGKSQDFYMSYLIDLLNDLKDLLETDPQGTIGRYLYSPYPDTKVQYVIDTLEVLKSINISYFRFTDKFDYESGLVGELIMTNSSTVRVYYLLTENKIILDINDIKRAIHNEVISKNLTIVLNCVDCEQAPVSKNYKLRIDYAPPSDKLINYKGLKISSSIFNSLDEFIVEANRSGIDIGLASGYRSYNEQVETYEYWIRYEKSLGYNDEQARGKASLYVAMPGHSEHQLGNTVDIKSAHCPGLSNCSHNQKVFEFIWGNAHNYGFIISYPPNRESKVGYKYEPWHLRFVGKENSIKMMGEGYLDNVEKYYTLFIIENNLY